MRNNQIINSSIIINIIINGKNSSGERPDVTTTAYWPTTTPAPIYSEAPPQPQPPAYEDPGFSMPAEGRNPEVFQKPDFGLLKLNDRRERPFISEMTTSPPA